MKIKEIRAAEITLRPNPKTPPRAPSASQRLTTARPVDRYGRLRGSPDAHPSWRRVACVATAEDGTWGLGITNFGKPVAAVINDHFAPLLAGQPCLATEKLWDMMARLTAPYGGAGLASYAISAIDTALWDLKGKLLGRPVYELLGGPQKDRIFCYATGFDVEWYLELGFRAVKVFTPYGPQDGLDGLKKNVDLVARTRETVGDETELMVDCWQSMDVEHTVRLAEALRPFRIKWLEEYAPADDLTAYRAVRARLPGVTLASGEHWYLTAPFWTAAGERLVDILQPDVLWCGGITSVAKVCHLAEMAGLSVITHAGMNYPYGQHLAFAMPAIPWGERSEGVSPPGVPVEEMVQLPGTAVVRNGYLTPSDAPGFGIEVTKDWLEAAAKNLSP